MIDISFDKKRMERAERLGLIMPKETARAAAAAINRTLTHIKKEASVSARKRYLVKAAAIKASFGTKKATSGSLSGETETQGRPLALTAFKVTRPAKGPMKAKVLKASAPKPVPGMFARQFPSGYTGPMVRLGRGRYPLKSPAGPSIPQMVGNENVLPMIAKESEDFLNKRLDHELDYRISKLLGG